MGQAQSHEFRRRSSFGQKNSCDSPTQGSRRNQGLRRQKGIFVSKKCYLKGFKVISPHNRAKSKQNARIEKWSQKRKLKMFYSSILYIIMYPQPNIYPLVPQSTPSPHLMNHSSRCAFA